MKVFKKRKLWLDDAQAFKMLDEAKAHSKRDYLLLLLFRWGLTVGEVTGYRDLPGIYKEDLRENGVWIRGKGWAAGEKTGAETEERKEGLYTLPQDVLQLLREFSANSQPGIRVFTISARQTERLVNEYAKRAGVEDWKLVGPHRLRAFFATNARDQGKEGFVIRDLMRHKRIEDTNTYIGRSTPAKIAKTIQELAEGKPV